MKSIADVIDDSKQIHEIGVYEDLEYDPLSRLNASSVSAGLLFGEEVDVHAVKQAYEGVYSSPSKPKEDGVAAHVMALEPDLVDDKIAVWSGGRKYGKSWDEFESENASKIILKTADYDALSHAADQIRKIDRVNELLSDCLCEVAVLGKSGSVYTKGRVDALNKNMQRIVDLKTTSSQLSQIWIKNSIRNFHYREKMSFYRRIVSQFTGVDPEDIECWNIFWKITQPISVRVVRYSSAALVFGDARIDNAMRKIELAIHENNWPVSLKEIDVSFDDWELPEEGDYDVESE